MIALNSLFVESIDLGEEKPRQILSGLRSVYKCEDLEGKMVIVLANMKERNMRGEISQGMVMCASNEDHSKIEILNPPQDAKPGDVVTFTGPDFASSESFSELGPDQVLATKKNKDPLAVILPEMRTDENRVAHWRVRQFVG